MAPEREPSSSFQSSSLLRSLQYILLGAFGGLVLSKLRDRTEHSDEADLKQDGTSNQTCIRANPTSGPLRVAIDSVPPPKPPTDQEKSEKERERRERRLKNRLEISATLITLGLLGVNILLWRSTQKASNAAKDSVELARVSAHMDQRAWVAVSDISPEFRQNDAWTISLIFKNTGKTPAKNFAIWGAGEPVAKGQKPASKETKLPGRGVIAPDGVFHSNLSLSGQYDWKSIDLLIHGRIDYDSVFGHSHWTKFCYYFVPNKTGRGGFAPCDSGNEIDDNPP